jgi:hypothetical protein
LSSRTAFCFGLRLSPVSLALLLQGFPRKCVPNAQCDDVVNSVREMCIDCKGLRGWWNKVNRRLCGGGCRR